MKLNITQNEIDLFAKDLWKDVRKLRIIETADNNLIFRRYSDGITTINSDLAFFRFLKEQNPVWKIPEIIDHSEDYIEFEYLRGIRLFNFMIELRYLYLIENSKKALELAERIKSILTNQLINFQTITQPWRKNISERYPFVEKCWQPIEIITNILSFEPNRTEIINDLTSIAEIVQVNSDSLFRDATPKNAILNLPELFFGNFKDDAERRITIRSLVERNYFTDELLNNSIYQFDFSGCVFLCPKVDDLIAINLQESMSWINSSKSFLKSNLDDEVFLATIFIRFMRFGCRKLAYRLLHIEGYKIRFRFDYEKYYFKELTNIIKQMQKMEIIKEKSLLDTIKLFEKATDIVPEKDYFKKENVDLSQYYADVFHSGSKV